MKKITVVALMAMCGFAMAATMAIPWFLDNGQTNAGLQQPYPFFVALIGVMNTTDLPIEADITYYSDEGVKLDYDNGTETEMDTTRNSIWSPTYHTFIIPPKATVQFRPVADDWDTANGGQESATGAAVPNRPRYNPGTSTAKKNGAMVISWPGAATDVQGRYVQSSLNLESAYLLPPAS